MRMELIGLEVGVTGPGHNGISGTVVDETRNTFTVRGEGRDRVVPKKGNGFAFTYEGSRTVIQGSEILHRPEDRIKKVR